MATTGTVRATTCSTTTTGAATSTASTPASTKITPLSSRRGIFSLTWGFLVLFVSDSTPLFGVTFSDTCNSECSISAYFEQGRKEVVVGPVGKEFLQLLNLGTILIRHFWLMRMAMPFRF
jgi:hypothetical protein